MWIQTSYNTSLILINQEMVKHLEEIMQVLVMNGMKIIKSFGPKKPHPSWVKNLQLQVGNHQ